MSPVVVIFALLVVATAAGFAVKFFAGRSREVNDGSSVANLPIVLGEKATLVQFSTEFCTKCPATRRALGELAARIDGVAHVEIDLTDDVATAQRFGILQTPTVFLVDPAGTIHSRAGGVPRVQELESQIRVLTA